MNRNFESAMVEHCAPTLAGIKPASLFRCCPRSGEDTRQNAHRWDRALTPLGLRVTILKECAHTGDCLIYVYRPGWINSLLVDAENKKFLASCGYELGGMYLLLQQLSERLCLEKDYPHEIGLFLGYPLTDVVGFIENRGKNYTCCGCWKSYSDPAQVQKYFELCRQCTRRYRELYANEPDLLRLVVAA